eukprot:TRINITY_DN57963_c0_g1_i2.p1 TRINITY_DN57963_c0_g1~~TRINITY_DN57963_c0_g1_i2.p1  ORF type:complete len:352 (+),score=111.46 TRINITY_DN57963_c0_g1_i2:73-1128(+)
MESKEDKINEITENTRILDIGTNEKKLGENIIECYDLTKKYNLEGGDDVTVLRGLSLNSESEFFPIRRGEFLMIRGPSGGGKTTLMNIIGTIDHPTTGSCKIMGETIDYSKKSDKKLARLRLTTIGFVFQTFNLLGTLSAFENVELPMSILGRAKDSEREARAKELLTMVGLQDRMSHLPSELSGGEQQRVTIARALANDPDILLLDEPTGDLDTRNTLDIMNLLLEVNHTKKMTMVMVTHNPDLECYADRILYVSDGKFSEQAINTEQTELEFESYMQLLNQDAQFNGFTSFGDSSRSDQVEEEEETETTKQPSEDPLTTTHETSVPGTPVPLVNFSPFSSAKSIKTGSS